MMKDFLMEYVKDMAEAKEIELEEKDLDEIVANLMENDELWDTFDSFIHEELDNYESEVE